MRHLAPTPGFLVSLSTIADYPPKEKQMQKPRETSVINGLSKTATKVKPGAMIAVWFSCGAASAVAAKIAVEEYGSTCDVRIINSPVVEEGEDNRRFLRDVEEWIGRKIEIAVNPLFPGCSAAEVWESKKAMSFANGFAPCTAELKKVPRQCWEGHNLFNFSNDNWLVLGFTSEEVNRHERFTLTERSNLLPVLIERALTKRMCWERLSSAGIRLPEMYLRGFSNANCVGCVKATSPEYWNRVRVVYPDQFEARAKLSRALGVKLARVKGRRVFLDELDPSARGRRMETFECGFFCEESAGEGDH